MMEQISTTCTRRLCVCASERMKLIGTIEGRYPDMGHHMANEMGGLWMYPVKLLDGFWMYFKDHDGLGSCWLAADGYTARPYGNTFHFRQGLGPTPVQIDLHQLAPEEAAGVILRYDLHNTGACRKQISLAFLARTDLRPAWSAAFLGAPDSGRDTICYLPGECAFHAKTEDRPWHVMFGSDTKPEAVESGELWGPEITEGNGASGKMKYELSLEPDERRTLYFFIAGSQTSAEDCEKQYQMLKTKTETLWKNKIERMERIARRADLTVEDKRFEEIYNWVKYNSDWLALHAPAGRGIAGGIPEYSWWFGCDSCYTVQGLLGMGDVTLARDTLKLLLEISGKQCGDGRIVHEIIPDGSVYHYGNTQETAHFVDALWRYYQWTGDEELLREALPYLDKSVEWLLAQDDDGDLFPSGYGIIEISGLNLELIDTAVYTAKAYEAYARIRRVLGIEDERNERFWDLAERLTQKLNTEMWDEEEGLYCDAFGCGRDVKTKLGAILDTVPEIRRAETGERLNQKLAKKPVEEESGWLINENWVINTPMEMELAPKELAERALKRMHTEEFIGPYGMYLSGVSRTHMMTVSTGVMAAAQVRYGYADRALELLYRMIKTFGMATPGSMSEMSPDYGCFVQAWTDYAMFVPVVSGFFGVKPHAEKGEIWLTPCMPSAWKKADLKDLPALGGTISLEYKREGAIQVLEIENKTDYPVRMFCDKELILKTGRNRVEWEWNGDFSPVGE